MKYVHVLFECDNELPVKVLADALEKAVVNTTIHPFVNDARVINARQELGEETIFKLMKEAFRHVQEYVEEYAHQDGMGWFTGVDSTQPLDKSETPEKDFNLYLNIVTQDVLKQYEEEERKAKEKS